MRLSPRAALAAYLAAMFLSLPFLPEAVSFLLQRVGRTGVFALLYGGLALLGLAPSLLLLAPPRPAPPWPHLGYLLLASSALSVAAVLASSPIGRVHLAEYGILAVLVLRSLPPPEGAKVPLTALALTVLVGLGDEIVQFYLPNRVFDWYDVALNGAAAALGVAGALWWSFTSRLRSASRDGGPRASSEGPGSPAGFR